MREPAVCVSPYTAARFAPQQTARRSATLNFVWIQLGGTMKMTVRFLACVALAWSLAAFGPATSPALALYCGADQWADGAEWSDNQIQAYTACGYAVSSDFTVGIQRMNWGYGYRNTGSVDGVFGSGTHQDVRSYQTLRGLSADGIVGPNTWTRYYNELIYTRTPNSEFVLYKSPGIAESWAFKYAGVNSSLWWARVKNCSYSYNEFKATLTTSCSDYDYAFY